MADVVAAPQRHVISDRRERLQRVVFENEAVFAVCEPRPDTRFRADVRGERIAFVFRCFTFVATKLVETGIAERNEHVACVRRPTIGDCFERTHRQVAERFSVQKLGVYREPNHITRRIVVEVKPRQLRDIAGSKNDDRLHFESGSSRTRIVNSYNP